MYFTDLICSFVFFLIFFHKWFITFLTCLWTSDTDDDIIFPVAVFLVANLFVVGTFNILWLCCTSAKWFCDVFKCRDVDDVEAVVWCWWWCNIGPADNGRYGKGAGGLNIFWFYF